MCPLPRRCWLPCRRSAADRSVRAVLLKGAGRAFVAGGDLATLQANPVQGAQDLLEPLNAAVTLLHGLDAPVIAQVHGAAAGAGLSLMLMCDFVLAAEGTNSTWHTSTWAPAATWGPPGHCRAWSACARR